MEEYKFICPVCKSDNVAKEAPKMNRIKCYCRKCGCAFNVRFPLTLKNN